MGILMKTVKIITLIIISLMLNFCSGKSDADMFEDASKLLTEKKYSEAVVVYEQILDEFPKGEKASLALFEMAKLYQGQVVKNLNPNESLLKSVSLYKKIFTDYPKSEKAESALFMASFILANDVKDYKAAKESYELYLETYPTGSLAKDAKIELENLGKTPEEILRDKLQPEEVN